MLEYKGYKISGSSTPVYMEGCESRGSVYKPARAGSIIELARIEGKIFKTVKEAERMDWNWRENGWTKDDWNFRTSAGCRVGLSGGQPGQ